MKKPKTLAAEIGECLRADFGTDESAHRTIGACTGATDSTAKKWLAGKGVPQGRHLIGLMRASPRVLAMVDRRSGRNEQVAKMGREILRRADRARNVLRGRR